LGVTDLEKSIQEGGETMKSKKLSVIAGIGCLFLISFFGLTSVTLMNAAEVKEVLIGNLHPLTGPLAPIGLQNSWGIKMAVEEINASGGIKSLGGAKFTVIDADTEGKPEVGMSECEKLIRKGVITIIGAYQSSTTYTTTVIAEKNKVPYLVPIAVADDITERGFKYTFRSHGNASGISRDCMKFIQYLNKITGKNYDKLALLYEDTIYGQSTAKAARKYAEEAGIKIVADLPYPHNAADLTATINKLKYAEPNFVIAPSYVNDAILILKTIRSLRVDVEGFLGIGSGFSNPQILRLGDTAAYLFCLDSLHGDMRIKGLQEAAAKFLKKYNVEMDGSAGESYASVYVLKDALERVGSIDREKVRDALAATDLAVGEKGNITTSRIKFNEKGQIEFDYMFKQILDKDYRSVYPVDLAARKPVFPVPKWKDRK
jgi:branched-chain amino acid transport system substrate-binding protein